MTPFCVLVFLGCLSLGFTVNPSCSPIRALYRGEGYPADDVPKNAVDGKDLQVCAKSGARYCCTKQMERNFESLSRQDFETAVWSKTDKILLKGLFSRKHKEFDDYFKSLIEKSKQALDKMFKETYRSHYDNNKKVFMDLFVELDRYYDGRNSDLKQVVNGFFQKVMIKMLEIYTSKNYAPSFVECVTKHMDELKLFGDIPEQLKTQVSRAFVVARTFAQALEIGKDVGSELGRISATVECRRHIVEMSYCSWCKAQHSLKPCNGLCVDVYKHCLFDLTQVNPHWDAYLKALGDILAKFVGPLSIENVLGELHMKISTGIMNYQEVLLKDKDKISKGCSNSGAKLRRSLESDNDFFLEGGNRDRRDAKDGLRNQDKRDVVGNLERMAMDFKRDVKVATNFWNLLPAAICMMPDIAAGVQSQDCWNGTAKGRYLGGDKPNNIGSSMSQQITQLKVITSQLELALNGEEVVIDPVGSGEGSASGSGSGSGVNEIPSNVPSDSPTDDINVIESETSTETDNNGVNLEAVKKNSGVSILPNMWLLFSFLFTVISRCT